MLQGLRDWLPRPTREPALTQFASKVIGSLPPIEQGGQQSEVRVADLGSLTSLTPPVTVRPSADANKDTTPDTDATALWGITPDKTARYPPVSDNLVGGLWRAVHGQTIRTPATKDVTVAPFCFAGKVKLAGEMAEIDF